MFDFFSLDLKEKDSKAGLPLTPLLDQASLPLTPLLEQASLPTIPLLDQASRPQPNQLAFYPFNVNTYNILHYYFLVSVTQETENNILTILML